VNQPTSISHIAVLIPARHLEPALGPLVDSLLDAGIGSIILVDDGSPREDKEGFDSFALKDRVHLLHHGVNRGKGRALKTGTQYFLNTFPEFTGLVTADADGQHASEDILRVANALLASEDRAILGCRKFEGSVPIRSRFGNALTRTIFRLVSGFRVSDTQTGLRAFPASLLPGLAALRGERYEYEMTVLVFLYLHGNVPLEVPILTIYNENNRSSHFKPVRDSIRIYSVLLRSVAQRCFQRDRNVPDSN
jgi:glycosyltransferase involved in cell wall biosynthesis